MTRVVLDVSDVSEYSAFLLPNPYRLIIDVHGGKTGGRDQGQGISVAKAAVEEVEAEVPVAPAAVVRASAAANSSGLPATAVRRRWKPEVMGKGKESGRTSSDTPLYPDERTVGKVGAPGRGSNEFGDDQGCGAGAEDGDGGQGYGGAGRCRIRWR